MHERTSFVGERSGKSHFAAAQLEIAIFSVESPSRDLTNSLSVASLPGFG